MSGTGEGDPLDGLLAAALAPPERQPDEAFVRRVDAAVLEEERYRRWRTNALRRLVTDFITVGAIGGSLAVLARSPVPESLPFSPSALMWPALLGLLLLWTQLMRTSPRTFR